MDKLSSSGTYNTRYMSCMALVVSRSSPMWGFYTKLASDGGFVHLICAIYLKTKGNTRVTLINKLRMNGCF